MNLRLSSQIFPGRQALAVLAAALISVSTAAQAADPSQVYRFEVVDQPVAASAHGEFDVKLTKTSTGQAVDGARITAGRLQMTMVHPPHKNSPPGGMTTKMGGEVKFLGTPTPGLYRFMGDVSMPGTWTLDLSATVPGESAPIEDTVTFKSGR
jgi:hypothetical protein